MNWLDYVLLGLVALAAIHGLRLGAIVQVLSFGGLFIGLFVGALLTPQVEKLVHSSHAKSVLAAVLVFGLAGILGGIGRVLGTRSSTWVHKLKLGPVDSLLGVAVGVVAMLFFTWIVASTMVNSRYTTVDVAISQSRIVRGIDDVLPDPPEVFSQIESFLSTAGFPVVFEIPPRLAGPVALPTNAEYEQAVKSARLSTVQIEGTGCGVIQAGSGFVVAPGVVITNAHVVAGIAHPQVIDAFQTTFAAKPIWFDPKLDLSVLDVPGLSAPILKLDPNLVDRGDVAAVLGYPYGGPFQSGSAAVEAEFKATGLDIYGNAETERDVYQIEALIRPGNSGGPLVEPDGTVIGVVFARSTTDTDVGYALASPAVQTEVNEAIQANTPTQTGPCAS